VLQEVESIEAAMAGPDYAPNSAQRRLAEEVTRFVHGEEGLRQALAATQVRPHASCLSSDLREAANAAVQGERCCSYSRDTMAMSPWFIGGPRAVPPEATLP